jgi:hypothetical protein
MDWGRDDGWGRADESGPVEIVAVSGYGNTDLF